MLDAVTAFLVRQYGGRLSPDDMLELASAMLDTYYSDPEYYAGFSLWQLADRAKVPNLAKGLTKL